MDLNVLIIAIVAANLTVLLAGCALAAMRTYRERRYHAPGATLGTPIRASSHRTRPAGRSSS